MNAGRVVQIDLEVLERAREYFDQRADVDNGIPNEEMKLMILMDQLRRDVADLAGHTLALQQFSQSVVCFRVQIGAPQR